MKTKSKEFTRPWIIHFSGDDWWVPQKHSRHHISREFHHKGYNILWINPIGVRFPSIGKGKKLFGKKIINKIKSVAKGLTIHKDGFYIYGPFFIPIFKRGVYERINTLLIGFQLSVLMKILNFEKAICFATTPSFASVIRSLVRRKILIRVIYYYSDQYDQYREIRNRGPIIEWNRMLEDDADAIYCASQRIFDNIPDSYKRSKVVKVMEHQVDFALFDYKKVTPKTLNIERPIIGYFGSLTDSNDWDMIRYAAMQRPEWNFVFIGHKRIDLPELEKMQNIHFLGYVPYAELSTVAVNFSVGIMFWKMTEWIKACSPLKLKEYLALGLPVVSVPIDEVVNKYSQYVVIAIDGPGFETAIENALNKHDRDERNKFASQFSWSSTVDEIMRDCNI